MSIFFEGGLYGLIFILSLGPSFLALFQTASSHGVVRAICVSVGINMTDAVMIVLVIAGLGTFMENEIVSFWLGLVGATILLIFGIISFRKKSMLKNGSEENSASLFAFWLKGIILNGFNPLMLLFWVGVVGAISAKGYSSEELYWFFGGFISTILLLDAIKAMLIVKLADRLNDRVLMYANKVAGVLFIGFGVRLLIYLFGGI